jgi:Ala-tRNA(Pro) deacylase
MRLTETEFLARLGALGIAHTVTRHAAVFTVEESRHLHATLPGAHTKNLYLRDKKGREWLVSADADRAIDLKALGVALGASGRLSFGSPERLMAALGVEPGSVTAFALVNDPDRRVTFVLDRALLDHAIVNFHPLVNTATVALSREDFLKFCDAVGHAPLVLDLPQRPAAAA